MSKLEETQSGRITASNCPSRKVNGRVGSEVPTVRARWQLYRFPIPTLVPLLTLPVSLAHAWRPTFMPE